jgi:hypothetical protein
VIAATTGYVAACYTITIATLVGYSGWTIAKYRKIVKRKP